MKLGGTLNIVTQCLYSEIIFSLPAIEPSGTVADDVAVEDFLPFLFLQTIPFPALFLVGTGEGSLGTFCMFSGSSFCSKNSFKTICVEKLQLILN